MKRLLIVADDSHVLNFYRDVLNGDYETEGTAYGPIALGIATNHKPDGIVISCGTQRTHKGMWLAWKLGEPYTGRVVIAGDAEEIKKRLQRYRLPEDYFAAVLQKPVSPKELTNAVSRIRWLESKRPRRLRL